MNKIWTIIKREYKETVFKKSFIIMTVLTPLLMVGVSVLPALLMTVQSEDQVTIHVLDNSHRIYPRLGHILTDTLKNGQKRFKLIPLQAVNNFEAFMKEEKQKIGKGEIYGLLFIPSDVMDNGTFEFYAKNVANVSINRSIRNAVNQLVTRYKIERSGLSPDLVKELTRQVEMKTVKITKEGLVKERGFVDEYFSTFVLVMILYMSLLLYGAAIMRSIVEEKSKRIVEVLLSQSNPFQLMAGKILGLGAVGITQYLIWISFGIGLIFFGGRIMPVSTKYFNYSPEIFIYFVLFYILGYLIFSVLYAGVGALSNTDREAQQLSMPIILFLIVPIMFIGYIIQNPDTNLSIGLSLFPLFSPILMFARINLADPGMVQILASILILIVSIIVLIWVVAKIFRVGILMYGKRPSLPEIIRWLRS
ncbi:MAG TPA: ABC transporter permease [Caldithrix abyssi]|uniref:ABC transporter permease n=1 Tax=Caldithrix abyssi TaxID=187145 RepID=A0A7V5PNT6_CALAY|nr:ABC transporter permease [Caldithrix abyssi]